MINSTSIRVLQLIDSLNQGGAERMAINIANLLHENNIVSTVCSTRSDGDLSKHLLPGVDLLLLNKKSFFDFRAIFILLKYVRTKEISIIHAHSSSIFWAVFAKLIKPKLKIIWHDHFGNRVNDSNRNLFYILFSIFFFRVIVVNSELENWAKKHLLINQTKILYLKNFPIMKISSKAQRHDDTIKIIYLANLQEPKNHHLLVEAINSICNKYTNIKIMIILIGGYQNDLYFNSLVSLIEKYGLTSFFTFTGSVDPSDYLSQADIGVICSTFEGLPVSLLEYGLAELSVVATAVGQCPEVLDYGNAGLLVKSGNISEFAEALYSLISDKLVIKEMGKRLKERVINNYGPSKFFKEYSKLIDIN